MPSAAALSRSTSVSNIASDSATTCIRWLVKTALGVEKRPVGANFNDRLEVDPMADKGRRQPFDGVPWEAGNATA